MLSIDVKRLEDLKRRLNKAIDKKEKQRKLEQKETKKVKTKRSEEMEDCY